VDVLKQTRGKREEKFLCGKAKSSLKYGGVVGLRRKKKEGELFSAAR
jgi:hypothetical protein